MNARKLRSLAGASALVVASAFVAGCGEEPSPKSVKITSRADAFETPELKDNPAVLEGDLLVLEVQSYDDEDKEMDLCPAVSSSDTAVAEIRSVRDKCRLFVALARKPGSAVVTFRARNTTSTANVTVMPSP